MIFCFVGIGQEVAVRGKCVFKLENLVLCTVFHISLILSANLFHCHLYRLCLFLMQGTDF